MAGYTHEAAPAILTGQGVRDDNLPPTPSGHPDTLFTLLANDYEIEAYEQLTELCTPSICDTATGGQPDLPFNVLLDDLSEVAGDVALPAMLDDWLPTVDDTWANFGQGAVDLDQEADELAEDRADFVHSLGERDRVGEYREAVAGIEASVEPQLTFIHTVFPQCRWSFHADGTPYVEPGNPGLVDNVWTTDGPPTSGSSGTCCRRSSPTGCWASCSTGWTRSTSTTTPSWSSPPTTVPRSQPVPIGGCRRR